MFCLYHFSVKCIIKKNYLPPYGPLKGTVFAVIRFLSFFLIVIKKFTVSATMSEISGLYDENCACGTHLKFMRHPHNDDSELS